MVDQFCCTAFKRRPHTVQQHRSDRVCFRIVVTVGVPVQFRIGIGYVPRFRAGTDFNFCQSRSNDRLVQILQTDLMAQCKYGSVVNGLSTAVVCKISHCNPLTQLCEFLVVQGSGIDNINGWRSNNCPVVVKPLGKTIGRYIG